MPLQQGFSFISPRRENFKPYPDGAGHGTKIRSTFEARLQDTQKEKLEKVAHTVAIYTSTDALMINRSPQTEKNERSFGLGFCVMSVDLRPGL